MGCYGVWIGVQDPMFWRSLWSLSPGYSKRTPFFFNYAVNEGRKLTPKYQYLYQFTLQHIPEDFNLQHRH